jgi:hypothetical protein
MDPGRELSSWPAEVTQALDGRVPSSCRIWMSGSALVRRRPKDLDLLITYQDGYEADALALTATIRAVARARRWPALDLTTITHAQAEQTHPTGTRPTLLLTDNH